MIITITILITIIEIARKKSFANFFYSCACIEIPWWFVSSYSIREQSAAHELFGRFYASSSLALSTTKTTISSLMSLNSSMQSRWLALVISRPLMIVRIMAWLFKLRRNLTTCMSNINEYTIHTQTYTNYEILRFNYNCWVNVGGLMMRNSFAECLI